MQLGFSPYTVLLDGHISEVHKVVIQVTGIRRVLDSAESTEPLVISNEQNTL
jgi:hypothetical protein